MRTILSIVLFAASIAAHAQQYQLQEMSRVPGYQSLDAVRMNERGQVTGGAEAANYTTTAFLYENESTRSVGPTGASSWGTGINNNGDVVGSWVSKSTHGNFLYSNGTVQELGHFGAALAYANDINDRGQIAGARDVDGVFMAFVSSNGVVQDLGTLGGESWALDINNAGQTVGYSLSASDPHAFLYENGSMRDLGTLGGAISRALAINDKGQVVGASQTADGGWTERAFLYENGSMRDLGTLAGFDGSQAYGINSRGDVVGFSYTEAGRASVAHAVLYRDGRMLDLNSMIDPSSPLALYVTFDSAQSIADDGRILVSGRDSRSPLIAREYILTPNPVPVPAAAWLFLSGFGGLLGVARRRQRA